MNRAARRRAARNGKRPELLRLGGPDIQLQNPVQDQFPAFIFGNATHWETMVLAEFERTKPEVLAAFQKAHEGLRRTKVMGDFLTLLNAESINRFVVEENSARGQHLILCGAGPSLAEEAGARCHGDQVWGCNSALTWLVEHGHRPSHGFTVDQTAEMLREWHSVPDVEYLLATTVHPHLTQFLMGRRRRIRFFNNYVGIRRAPVDCGDGEILPYEDWLYSVFFPPTIRTGAGLNAVNRAIDLAVFMDFAKITVLGADCALRFTGPAPNAPIGSKEHQAWLRDATVMHADGGSALASNATMLTLSGLVDGREWLTKPDLMISAVWLEKQRQQYGEKLELIGDTLPNALRGKSDEYLRRLPTLVDSAGKPLPWT